MITAREATERSREARAKKLLTEVDMEPLLKVQGIIYAAIDNGKTYCQIEDELMTENLATYFRTLGYNVVFKWFENDTYIEWCDSDKFFCQNWGNEDE